MCAARARGGDFFRFLEGALSSVGFWLGFFLSLSFFLRAKGSREKIQGVQRGVFNLYAPLYFRRCFGQIKNYKIFRMRDTVQRVTTSYCRPRFPLALPYVLFFHFFSLRKLTHVRFFKIYRTLLLHDTEIFIIQKFIMQVMHVGLSVCPIAFSITTSSFLGCPLGASFSLFLGNIFSFLFGQD